MGEVGDDDDGLGAGVVELVLQLARSIEGLTLTTVMPARSMPNTAMGYCSRFGIITATRSSPCRA